MAKGDSGRAQNQISYQGGLAQNVLNNNMSKLNDQYGSMLSTYNDATKQQMGDYTDIMNNYKNTQSGIAGSYQPMLSSASDLMTGKTGGVGVDNSKVDQAIAGFQGFADTGGFSGSDIQDIRARAVSPTRSIYSQGAANLARGNALAGGYSPNMAAGQAQMARQQSQQISDADISANANIAQMVQQGKLYGLTGMSNAALAEQSNAIQAANASNQARIGGINAYGSGLQGMYGAELGAGAGMRDLYGTTPGLMSTAQQGLLGTGNQLLTGSGQQNQLGLGLINAQIAKGSIPGDFQQGVGNVTSALGLLGSGASALGGLSGTARTPLTSTQTIANMGYLPTGNPGLSGIQ